MKNNRLRRYTTLPVLLDILINKKLTLLDPHSWEDTNDSYYIEVYKQKSDLKSVLALCFTEAGETYHHWKVFSGNPSGVCIIFKKNKILECLNSDDTGIKSGSVIYKKIRETKILPLRHEELPFIKRFPFKDEKEFRCIYEDASQEITYKDVNMDISCIDRIVFNPWIPKSVFDSVKKVIKNIDGCKGIRIFKTTLVDNEEWKKMAR